ncbi:DUF4288 domain-containing protein [Actinomycetospora sp. NBRC 106375]|uniref:DUF4288 domain-containing protein n=1 Tax=Actinomycetospora sp. NBRC 106375 TaxID=3032207 RepID=UPI0025541A6A|nr:DUF4288 domain-containing protein [Actinomycetospora sp. NBRC 106375]
MTATEPWVAILVFRSTSEAPDYQAVYREDVTVFPAASEAEARAAALTHARARETIVVNHLGETVVTSLVRLVDVAPVLGGGELYRRHFRDLDAYRRFEPLMASTSW